MFVPTAVMLLLIGLAWVLEPVELPVRVILGVGLAAALVELVALAAYVAWSRMSLGSRLLLAAGVAFNALIAALCVGAAVHCMIGPC